MKYFWLAALFLGLAYLGFIHQILLGADWNWADCFSWIHHETLISACVIVAIILLAIYFIKELRRE